MQYLGCETETLENPWTKILHENICFIDETQKHCSIIGVLQIKINGAFVAVNESPPQTFAIFGITPCHVAQTVARIRTLNFDDIGAKVGEVSRTVGSSKNGGKVNDLQAFQCGI